MDIIFTNQVIIEVKSFDNTMRFKLYRQKEPMAVLALIDFIIFKGTRNKFALSYKEFEITTGFKKTSYHSAFARLKELNILKPTQRYEADKAQVYEFNLMERI